ncbi:hypothetical protein BPOR_0716g00010 [Botrytis porri]|uniref:Uncharacterized protein n=1 Tax=Botrytis porri TaxID=87229 RepID=A0A4Z1KP80_9HELO|nr:hypothetical protein BPOR_0716g00010 [Botrytis porri]
MTELKKATSWQVLIKVSHLLFTTLKTMSKSALNMAGTPEINDGIRDLKAYMEENPSLWQQPAYRWAAEAMLWRFNGLLTDHKEEEEEIQKKKTTVGNSTVEAILTTVETGHSPTSVPPMAKEYVLTASSMLDQLMALSDAGINSSDQAVATSTFSETEQIAILEELDKILLKCKSADAPEELRPKPVKDSRLQFIEELRYSNILEESRQQSIEDLKAEHQRVLADLTKKHEAIKFENRNLKVDRNKELEELRKGNSTLRGMSSGLEQEVTQLRAELQLKPSALEWATSELKDEVYRLKRDNSKLIESLLGEQLKTNMSSSKIQELQAKVVTLEEERTILEPLIEVGVAVRKRVFEQAKYAVSLGEIFSRADHKIIREGNDHCHRAKCLADAAIFKLFYLSGSSNEALYNKIYYIDSQADVMSLPLKLRQALDSNASIRTVPVINDSTTSLESLVTWQTLKISSARNSGSGLNARQTQERSNSESVATTAMILLTAKLPQHFSVSQTAAGNFAAIPQEANALKNSVAQQLGDQD